jgi:hypothetical protein
MREVFVFAPFQRLVQLRCVTDEHSLWEFAWHVTPRQAANIDQAM